MSDGEFTPYPKTPRLFRDMVVTEKIDGTNAAIQVVEASPGDSQAGCVAGVWVGDRFFKVAAQSRKRLITPDEDNFGFAQWVGENAELLTLNLGAGIHFGEWWGSGIQRGYGLTEKRFSLFNVKRWSGVDLSVVPGLDVTPVLARYTFDQGVIRNCIDQLRLDGSVAAPGFMKPEGVVVYHTASGQVFKVLLEDDHMPKGLAA